MKQTLKITTVLMLLALFGCAQTEQAVQIGGIFALTGYGASWGSAEQKAVVMAFEEANAQGGINGKKIELVSEDSKTESTQAVTALQKLIGEDIQFVIGTTWEADSTAIAPIAAENRIIMISPSSYKGIQDKNSEFLFSTYPPYGYEIDAMKRFFAEHKMQKFVIIYNNEFFSQIMKGLFEEEAAKNGWTVTGAFALETQETDFRTVLLKIKGLQVDAIYAPLATDDPGKGLLLKQMRELGIDLPVISTASTETETLLKNYGKEVEGIIYAFPVEAPKYEEFSAKFETRYGEKPGSPSASTAYDAAKLLIMALQNGKTPEEISAFLHKMQAFEGASNKITFDEQGIIASKEYKVKTVRNGQFTAY